MNLNTLWIKTNVLMVTITYIILTQACGRPLQSQVDLNPTPKPISTTKAEVKPNKQYVQIQFVDKNNPSDTSKLTRDFEVNLSKNNLKLTEDKAITLSIPLKDELYFSMQMLNYSILFSQNTKVSAHLISGSETLPLDSMLQQIGDTFAFQIKVAGFSKYLNQERTSNGKIHVTITNEDKTEFEFPIRLAPQSLEISTLEAPGERRNMNMGFFSLNKETLTLVKQISLKNNSNSELVLENISTKIPGRYTQRYTQLRTGDIGCNYAGYEDLRYNGHELFSNQFVLIPIDNDLETIRQNWEKKQAPQMAYNLTVKAGETRHLGLFVIGDKARERLMKGPNQTREWHVTVPGRCLNGPGDRARTQVLNADYWYETEFDFDQKQIQSRLRFADFSNETDPGFNLINIEL